MRDGSTCVMHPDSGLFVQARELTPDEWRRLVEMEAATRAVMDSLNRVEERDDPDGLLEDH